MITRKRQSKVGLGCSLAGFNICEWWYLSGPRPNFSYWFRIDRNQYQILPVDPLLTEIDIEFIFYPIETENFNHEIWKFSVSVFDDYWLGKTRTKTEAVMKTIDRWDSFSIGIKLIINCWDLLMPKAKTRPQWRHLATLLFFSFIFLWRLIKTKQTRQNPFQFLILPTKLNGRLKLVLKCYMSCFLPWMDIMEWSLFLKEAVSR